ncbi:PepSY-associated TM helix domain-containing protein [Pseudonocardia spinosispora]|uniref:PepSY-associated TM helix domain-containing protein n=1 Tax=Pseudonocardia spinosispora TaxID=103441 RepID=UPI00042407DF|nr:PepSY-associated TM helix domain-containing protein [Pseudonocardia spinosispora]
MAAKLHRWIAIVGGVVLVVFVTTGALLVFRVDIQRAMNPAATAIERLPGDRPVSLAGAREAVENAHPEFQTGRIWFEGSVLRVYNTTRTHWWSVDPGSGRVLGHDGTALDGAWGLLANLHMCAMSCPQYPGYLAWMANPLFGTGVTPEMVFYTGLLLTVLTLVTTGLWLSLGSLRTALRVRWSRRGSFARNSDLHRVVGLVMAPFLLVWAFTGAGFVVPAVEDLWFALTPGEHRVVEDPVPPAQHGPDIGLEAALQSGQKLVGPGHPAVHALLPKGKDPSYQFRFETAPTTYGDVTDGFRVRVDRYTGAATYLKNPPGSPTATVLWENWAFPLHSGILVPGWWRAPWLLIALTPLALGLTGLSAHLFRRSVRRRIRDQRSRRAAPPAGSAVETPAGRR